MRFTQFLLVESYMGTIDQILNDVLNQFAEENRWNHDDIMAVVERRLNEIPEFAENPSRKEAALEIVSDQIKPMSEDASEIVARAYANTRPKGKIPKQYMGKVAKKTELFKQMKKREKKEKQ